MEKIKFYLTLKAGEVWAEVMNALDAANVEPTSTDLDLLRNGMAANCEHVAQLRRNQQQLLDADYSAQTKELESTYADIKFRHYADEAAKARQADIVDRTSRHSHLVAARQRQREQLAKSRKYCDAVAGGMVSHHEAEVQQDSYNGTVFPSQLVLSGLLQPGADGTANDDTIRLDSAGLDTSTSMVSEIEAS